MDKELKLQITNLAKFIFTDAEYIKFMYYLNNNHLNNLRLLVDEKYELLEIISSMDDDEVVLKQLQYCDELEDLVIDICIEAMN